MVDRACVTPGGPDSGAASAESAVRVALAHDWLVGFRGGEAVLDRIARAVLAEHAPGPLLTMFDAGGAMSDAIDRFDRRVSWLDRWPGGWRRWLLPLYPIAVRDLGRALQREHEASPVRLVVSTSSAAIKGLRAPAGVRHVCYCHSPARYVWSQREQYADASLKGQVRGLGLRALGGRFARWDRASAAHVDVFLANSTHTAAEIRRCFGRDSEVVHPPARTDYFTPDESVEREDFWLFVGALEPYKRADLALDAARARGARLKVVGTGSGEAQLRAVASGGACRGVELLGRVGDEALRDLYRRARLLVFPQVEDFGIVAVEAQACGCPVVARRAGGALDSVIEGETGAFFDRPEAADVVEAAARAPAGADAACRANAERFGEDVFDRRVREILARELAYGTG